MLQCVAVCCSVFQAVYKVNTSSPSRCSMYSACNTLQHTATHCNTLQHTAATHAPGTLCALSETHCNTLQQHTAATHVPHLYVPSKDLVTLQVHCITTHTLSITLCNTLQHLQHTTTPATHYNTCNTLQHLCNTLQHLCNTLQHLCNTLQHLCNTLQHLQHTTTYTTHTHGHTHQDCVSIHTHNLNQNRHVYVCVCTFCVYACAYAAYLLYIDVWYRCCSVLQSVTECACVVIQ